MSEIGMDNEAPAATEPAAAEPVPGESGSGSFYGWLWRRLPGRVPVKVVVCVLLVAAVVVLLFGVVFPWLEPRLPFGNETVTGGGG